MISHELPTVGCRSRSAGISDQESPAAGGPGTVTVPCRVTPQAGSPSDEARDEGKPGQRGGPYAIRSPHSGLGPSGAGCQWPPTAPGPSPPAASDRGPGDTAGVRAATPPGSETDWQLLPGA